MLMMVNDDDDDDDEDRTMDDNDNDAEDDDVGRYSATNRGSSTWVHAIAVVHTHEDVR